MTTPEVDIVVGLPTFEEAETVRKVAEACSAGLRDHFADSRAVLVNADSDSKDGTRESFLSASTSHEKLYVNSGGRGKGRNVRRILEIARERQAPRAAIVDGDLGGITPAWMQRLLSPLDQYSYVTPYYRRQKYDGNCTNHVCYPLLHALTGKRLRQPIGGEFAFSRPYLDHLLSQPWHQEAERFGIDIFMTMTAVLGRFPICQARLPPKKHRPRDARHATTVLVDVIASLFNVIHANRETLGVIDPERDPPVVGGDEGWPLPSREAFHEDLYAKTMFDDIAGMLAGHLDPTTAKAVRDSYAGAEIRLEARTWSRALLELVRAYLRSGKDERVITAATALSLGRIMTFHREVRGLSEDEAEARVMLQAAMMAADRRVLLERL